MKQDFSRLTRQLAYNFNDINLLKQALSHRSYGKKNNERLEFLGDAILGFVIAEALYDAYPNDNEGKLSRYRSLLVRGETLVEIAKEFQLGDYLLLGGGELKSGGYRRKSILSDAMEAIIGAILLDSDINQAKTCVLNWYQQRILNVHHLILKDAKSRLQEYLQARQLELPDYQVLKIEGEEHNQTFTIQCSISELQIKLSASAKSRRRAEQEAAEEVLKRIDKKKLKD